jgi:hypothetical protein
LTNFLSLSDPLKGVQIPETLKVFSGERLAFVAHGSSAGLMTLFERGKSSALDLSYQILDFSTLQNMMVFPVLIIPVDLSFDQQGLANAEAHIETQFGVGKPFAVYDIGHGRMVFFTPRNILKPEIDAGVLQGLKVKPLGCAVGR